MCPAERNSIRENSWSSRCVAEGGGRGLLACASARGGRDSNKSNNISVIEVFGADPDRATDSRSYQKRIGRPSTRWAACSVWWQITLGFSVTTWRRAAW